MAVGGYTVVACDLAVGVVLLLWIPPTVLLLWATIALVHIRRDQVEFYTHQHARQTVEDSIRQRLRGMEREQPQ